MIRMVEQPTSLGGEKAAIPTRLNLVRAFTLPRRVCQDSLFAQGRDFFWAAFPLQSEGLWTEELLSAYFSRGSLLRLAYAV